MNTNSKEIEVKKKDIYKYVYFITELSQKTGDKGMFGTLSGKGDLMGGIFDRWINLVPESIIFNKYLLPKISQNKKVEVITDFYKYKPKQETTGIAPDVLGLKIGKKAIPFVVFDEKWTAVKGMPEIEVKTFKKNQQMVSLRDQGYDQKYLVMIESDYRVDYLLPLLDCDLFTDDVYKQMVMNDDVFIKSDKNNQIGKLSKIEDKGDKLGTLKLLSIIRAKKFKDCATLCEAKESPLRISYIGEYTGKRITNLMLTPKNLSNLCQKKNWGKNIYCLNNILGREKGIKYLDFYCNDVKSIEVVKINKNSIYIKALKNCIFNDIELKKNYIYHVYFTLLDREGASNQEYFLQKELVKYLPDSEEKLSKELSDIISEV